ncbi:hypothetical protein, partial [Butyricicoccus sp.]|uniref:hypothetical protein n=1 Tax=Butyricicoccus sp. TaxID=2049021 RepID=UPI003F14E3D4
MLKKLFLLIAAAGVAIAAYVFVFQNLSGVNILQQTGEKLASAHTMEYHLKLNCMVSKGDTADASGLKSILPSNYGMCMDVDVRSDLQSKTTYMDGEIKGSTILARTEPVKAYMVSSDSGCRTYTYCESIWGDYW